MTTLAEIHRLEKAGRFAEALAAIIPFAEYARAEADVLIAIDATMLESMLHTRCGDPATALARATWALGVACHPIHRQRLESNRHAWKITMAFYAWCDTARSHADVTYEAVAAVAEEAQRFLVATGREHWRAGVLAEQAAVLVARERHAESVPLWREAAALKERFPSAPGMTHETILRDLGRALDHSGATEEAAVVLRDLLALPQLPLIDQLAAHCYLGHNALHRKAAEEAVRCANAALDVAEALGERQLIPALGLAVDARLAAGDGPGARSAADRILEIALRIGSPIAQFHALQDNFEVALHERDLDDAQARLADLDARADALDRRVGSPEYRGRVDERRARLAAATAELRSRP
jgi:tetratricopeptide (TPR) repeat protein